jgi:hypothetical protein
MARTRMADRIMSARVVSAGESRATAARRNMMMAEIGAPECFMESSRIAREAGGRVHLPHWIAGTDLASARKAAALDLLRHEGPEYPTICHACDDMRVCGSVTVADFLLRGAVCGVAS